ncbi:MAG: hydrolase [Pseudomonadales bacterium]|nr:hydrolase [Pseudomonadales bacterium]
MSHTHQHGMVVPAAFRPIPGLAHAHVQTVFPALLRPRPKLLWRMERFELPDGDFVDVAWHGTGHGPRLIMVHGLGGGLHSKYACGLAQRMGRQGWRVGLLLLRGAGPDMNRLPRGYHHGDTADFQFVLQQLHQREPEGPLLAAGWSLGANIVLKSLGEEGDRSLLSGAAVASPPFQLEPCIQRLEQGVSRGYQRYLLRGLQARLRTKRLTVSWDAPVDIEAALRARCFRDFDEAYTAPVHGFSSAREYYALCECSRFLQGIRRPTLIVHALDDPFMQPDILPEARHLSASVRLEFCEQGGHIGFMGGSWLRPQWWLETRMEKALLAALPVDAVLLAH